MPLPPEPGDQFSVAGGRELLTAAQLIALFTARVGVPDAVGVGGDERGVKRYAGALPIR